MDPNGFEVADKCEFGPQRGNPLGFAPDGSPYNQVINGHQYLIQEMWSNDDNGCVQQHEPDQQPAAAATGQPDAVQPDRHRQHRHQHGGRRRQGDAAARRRRRNPVPVAKASTTTAADGSWSVSLAPHAVGDDRDQIDVDYSRRADARPPGDPHRQRRQPVHRVRVDRLDGARQRRRRQQQRNGGLR